MDKDQNTQNYMFQDINPDQEIKEEIEFTRHDILAFIIATFQVVMPIFFCVLGAFVAVMLLMQFLWFR